MSYACSLAIPHALAVNCSGEPRWKAAGDPVRSNRIHTFSVALGAPRVCRNGINHGVRHIGHARRDPLARGINACRATMPTFDAVIRSIVRSRSNHPSTCVAGRIHRLDTSNSTKSRARQLGAGSRRVDRRCSVSVLACTRREAVSLRDTNNRVQRLGSLNRSEHCVYALGAACV